MNDRLDEMWEEIRADFEKIALKMARFDERLQGISKLLVGPKPPTPRPEPKPKPEPRPVEPPAPMQEEPLFQRGILDPLVWAEIVKHAPSVGVRPETLAAIQVWESDWYTSDLFRESANVGGIKDSDFARRLPGYVGPSESGTYAAFTDWRTGIAAHAKFLGQKRYDEIRDTDDPAAEVLAIHKAGYAEHSETWLEGVTKLAKQFTGFRLDPAQPPGNLPAAIRAELLALPDPFPYHSSTEEGELGCANVISYALMKAGILDKIEVAVRFLVAELKRRGWRRVNAPYQDGDIVEWGPRPGGVHGHIGGIVLMGDKVITVQNSSSKRKVVQIPLDAYDRPLVQVLRAPGGE